MIRRRCVHLGLDNLGMDSRYLVLSHVIRDLSMPTAERGIDVILPELE